MKTRSPFLIALAFLASASITIPPDLGRPDGSTLDAEGMLWIAMFKHADKLADWLSSAEGRGGGKEIQLSAVLLSRAVWLDFSFTPLCR
jgi:hypothetical protein